MVLMMSLDDPKQHKVFSLKKIPEKRRSKEPLKT